MAMAVQIVGVIVLGCVALALLWQRGSIDWTDPKVQAASARMTLILVLICGVACAAMVAWIQFGSAQVWTAIAERAASLAERERAFDKANAAYQVGRTAIGVLILVIGIGVVWVGSVLLGMRRRLAARDRSQG